MVTPSCHPLWYLCSRVCMLLCAFVCMGEKRSLISHLELKYFNIVIHVATFIQPVGD